MQSIKGSDGASDMLILSTLNEFGGMVDSYNWVNYGGESGEEECWLDGNTGDKAEGVTFQPGQGLWVESYDSAITITTSGQVGVEDTCVELRDGVTMIGNPTPVAIDLQDIIADGSASDMIIVSTLNEFGGMVDSYNWVNYGGESGEEECWLDGNTGDKAEGVTILPGQGLWAESYQDGLILTFPGVEL